MAERGSSAGGAERRRRPRVPVHGEVIGRIHTMAAAPFIDFSETGALLAITCSLNPGAFYSLRFQFADGAELTLRTRVVRSYVHGFTQKPGGESVVQYRAAVEFVQVSEAEREILRRHIGGPATPTHGSLGEERK